MITFRMCADNWASLMLTVSWQLAALAALAWMCEKVFRLRQARARYALWWFALAAPLLLAPVRLALSQTPAVVTVPVALSMPLPAALPASAKPMPRPAISLSPAAAGEWGGPAAAARPAKQGSWRPDLRAADVLCWLWLLGCAGFTLRLLVGYRQVRKMLAQSRPAKDRALQDLFAALCSEAALQNPAELRVSDTIGAPAICGILQPKILLPATWLETTAAEELRALLAHEVAHIKRRDPVTNFLQRLIEIPLFFHPAGWWASRKITLVREELCDGWVLHRGADAAGYARFLVAAAENARGRSVGVVVGLAEGRSTLLHRVEAIMRTPKNGKISRVTALVVAAVVLLCAGAFAVVSITSSKTSANGLKNIEKQNPQSNDRSAGTLMPATGGISSTETEEALRQLGLVTARYTYEVPFEHDTTVSIEYYEKGILKGQIIHSTSAQLNPGKHNLQIFAREIDHALRFSFSLTNQFGSSSSMTDTTVSLKGYNSRSESGIPVDKLVFGKKIPIWSIAAQKRATGTSESYIPSEGVEKYIAKNDLVIIAFVKIEPSKASTPGAAPQALPLAENTKSAQPSNTAPVPGTVFDTIDLSNLDAEEMKILFGAASLPVATDLAQRPEKQNSKDLLQGINSQSPFKSLLPPGVTIISPGEHGSRQLVVSGTPEGIARTRELLRIFDQQAKKARLEVSYCAGAPEKASPRNWVALKLSGPKDLRAEIGSAAGGPQSGIREESLKASLRSIEALNNVPVRTILSPSGWPQMMLMLVPRINGDSSITFFLKLGLLDPKEKPEAAAARAEAAPILKTIINVKSNEECALTLARPQGKLTIIIGFSAP